MGTMEAKILPGVGGKKKDVETVHLYHHFSIKSQNEEIGVHEAEEERVLDTHLLKHTTTPPHPW